MTSCPPPTPIHPLRVLNNRRWFASREPFHHYHVKDVFREDFLHALESDFRDILSRGLANRPDHARFSRMPGYDAYSWSFRGDHRGALALFHSRPWHDLLAATYTLEATGDVRGGLHHHSVESKSGHVHNDLNPGWFAGNPDSGVVNLCDSRRCSYHTGAHEAQHGPVRQTVRAIAAIFYLCNERWQLGDGGETALFAHSKETPRTPALLIPPLRNSLLVFECTPVSWHTFSSNKRSPRNSVIQWLHRPHADAIRRWGANSIVKWNVK